MSKEHFETGQTEAKGLGYNPVNVPSQFTDDSGIVKPSSEIKIEQDESSASPLSKTMKVKRAKPNIPAGLQNAAGKSTVGMNDALNAVRVLHNHLTTVHGDVLKGGVRHPELKAAKDHLDEALHHIGQTALHQASATSMAWEHLERAGSSINRAHDSLSRLTVNAMGASVPMRVGDIVHDIRPGGVLSHITKNPSPPSKSKAPKQVGIGGIVVPAADVKGAIALEEGREGTDLPGSTSRKELRKAVKKKMRPTPKVNKQRRLIGPLPKTADPKVSEEPLERLGQPAVDTSKVAEYSGTENKNRGNPESVIDKVDKAKPVQQGTGNKIADAPVTLKKGRNK